MNDFRHQMNEIQPNLAALRREFHEHPELSLEEHRTAARIEEELDKLGVSHRRVGETGVWATIRGEKPGDKAIALRADIDALPIEETNDVGYRSRTAGVMHACGHDAHAACLLGAARLLAQNRAAFGGEVRLIFQPGEEIGKGAKPFIEAGVLEGAGRVFGLHTAAEVPSGTVGLKPGLNNAGVDFFRITVKGKSAHVSQPQLGVDALYIASQIVVAVQGIVTRTYSPVEPVIVGIGKMRAGTTYNAIAAEAVLEGTTRTVSHESRARVRGQIEQLARETAAVYGGEVDLFWDDFASPLINDAAVSREAARAAETVGLRVITDRALSLSGDNFAEYLLACPGAYAYLGTGAAAKPGTCNPPHNGNFDIDEDALKLGAGLYAAYAMQYLNE